MSPKGTPVATVLLAEAGAEEVSRVRDLLEPSGARYELKHCEDLDGALKLLQEGGVDVLLFGGARAGLASLQEAAPSVPVILLEEYEEEAVALPTPQDGVWDRLVKGSYGRDLLIRSLAHAMEYAGLKREISVLRRQLAEVPHRDELTGLLSREGIGKRLDEEVRLGRRKGNPLLALLIVLEGLDHLEASAGPEARVQGVREMAARLREALREGDCVGRVTGESFLLLMPTTRLGEGRTAADRIRRRMVGPSLVLYVQEVRIGLRFGLVEVPLQEACTLDHLVDLARHALKAGDEPAPGSPEIRMGDVLDRLRKSDPFHVVKLPIVKLGTGQKAGYEIFARSTIQGFERPDDFFRISQDANLLAEVDQACLGKCVSEAIKIPHPGRYHVNLFPSTLLKIPMAVLSQVFPANRKDKRFCVEISQRWLTGDPSLLLKSVNDLKRQGIGLAIDDLGLGMDALESMVVLRPSFAKIDHRVMHGIAWDPGRARALKRLSSVLKSLGAEVIVEGVETPEDKVVAQEAGADYGQGFLWGEPD